MSGLIPFASRASLFAVDCALGLNRDDKEPYRLGMAADWLWDDRIATTFTPTVAPGEVGEFRFKVRAD